MVKPINIGLLMHASASWMGGAVYIQNLVKAIATLPKEDRETIRVHLITSSKTSLTFYQDLLPLVDTHQKIDFLSTKPVSRIIRWLENFIPSIQKLLISTYEVKSIKEEIDFFYPLIGEREVFWNLPVNRVSWIPDFQHKYLPDFFSTRERMRRDKLHQKMIKDSSSIIFSSQTALSDFEKFYPETKTKLFVLRFCTTPEKSWLDKDFKKTQEKYNIPKDFFIISNQFWQHKNHAVVIEALNFLQKKSVRPVVVCTGTLDDKKHSNYVKELLNLVEKYKLQAQILFLGLIPRIDQIQLMRSALAVIQPSLFEGWSTVVEDARTLGKVILLSNLPVHIEQDPPYGLYFSPNSVEELAENINKVLSDVNSNMNKPYESQELLIQKSNNYDYAQEFLKIARQIS
jgi:glycosyltransferase involved in cell wall biosynthesis